MDKNLLRFYLIAFPIILLTLAYLQWSHRGDQAAKAERDAHAAQEQVADGKAVASAPASPTAQPEFVPTKESLESAKPTPETEPERRPEVPLERIETESFRVAFSPAGGVPVQWEVVDLHAKSVSKPDGEAKAIAKPEGDVKSADAPPRKLTPGWIPLIDASLDSLGLDRPLEIILKEDNAKYYNELNQKVCRVSRRETEEEIALQFESPASESGVQLVKSYTFARRGPVFKCRLTLKLINSGGSRVRFNDRGQGLGIALGPGLGYAPPDEGGVGGARYDYTSPVYHAAPGVVPIRPPKPGATENFVIPSGGIDWAGLHDRYFMMVLIAGKEEAGEGAAKTEGFTSGNAKLDPRIAQAAIVSEKELAYYPRMELYGESFALAPGESKDFEYTIFAGPKDRKVLRDIKPPLDDILFFGSYPWMRVLALMLMSLLSAFHALLHSWGLAIIAVVLTVRLVTFPVAQIGLKSQARMMAEQAKLKPFLDKINEKYKDDKQKRSQEMMKLYREHNVNPLGMFKGCLWMVIQLPIFYALYTLLSQSFDLRGASFLWIEDLSAPDHLFPMGFSLPLLGNYFNLLPMLTSGTQMLLSKLSMNPSAIADPQQAAMQKQMMYMVPIMVFVMTYSFPSGLTLYWLISNIWQFFQQQFVNKKILRPAQAAAGAAK